MRIRHGLDGLVRRRQDGRSTHEFPLACSYIFLMNLHSLSGWDV